MKTLDECLGQHQGGSVRLIKMDVEGAEPDVVAGASETLSRRPRPSLIVATHGWRAHASVLERLTSLGYRDLLAERDGDSGHGSVLFRSSDGIGDIR